MIIIISQLSSEIKDENDEKFDEVDSMINEKTLQVKYTFTCH